MDKDAQGELDLGGEAAAERGETVKGREAPKEQSEGKVHWLPIGAVARQIAERARQGMPADAQEKRRETQRRRRVGPFGRPGVVIVLRQHHSQRRPSRRR